jgi:hypothetical protein
VGRPETDARPPRRFVAVTAFCALAAIGAGGSYLAATAVFAEQAPAVTQAAPGPDRATGTLIGSRDDGNASRAEKPGGAGKPGAAGTGQPRGAGRPARDAMGSVPMAAGRPRTTKPAAVAEVTPPVAAPPVAVKPAPGDRRPVAAPPRATRSASPECHCLTPPVPTPTSLPESPSAPASPAPATTPAGPSATASASPSATPSSSTGDGHHRRRHRPAAG